MAKKFGSFVFLATLTGAVAGIVSYLYKYRKFSEAVDQDFTDVMDSAMEVKDSAKRSYTILKDSRTKEDFKTVAKDLGYAAKNLAIDTKNLAIDTKNLAVDAGKDAYKAVKEVWDKKKTVFSDDEDAVDSEDVDVEFFYENQDESTEENNSECVKTAESKQSEEQGENGGLIVTEEV